MKTQYKIALAVGIGVLIYAAYKFFGKELPSDKQSTVTDKLEAPNEFSIRRGGGAFNPKAGVDLYFTKDGKYFIQYSVVDGGIGTSAPKEITKEQYALAYKNKLAYDKTPRP